MSTNTSPEKTNSAPEITPHNTLTTIVDSVGNLVSDATIPDPIRKNALKAFNQLCTAAIDIPVAFLEGIAAEKRAETQARIKIIATGSEQIAAQMNVDPEFARVAVKKYGQKIVREQVNLDRVSEIAAAQIQSESALPEGNKDADKNIPPINGDWLNNFEKEASQKSTEEMQLLFGRILAGEIKNPSSFSIKTIKLIGQLDGQAANLFRTLCSLSVSLRVQDKILDARVLSLGESAASNSLQAFGLGFDQLNLLHEYGLIISDYNSYMNYNQSVANGNIVGLPFKYQNSDWGLLPVTPRPAGQELRLHGVSLSRSGKELLKIVDIDPNSAYTAKIQDFFSIQNMRMVEISS